MGDFIRVVNNNALPLPKTNMDTQNDGLEKVTPFRVAILGIHVCFRGCILNKYHPVFFLLKWQIHATASCEIPFNQPPDMDVWNPVE